jgi:DNA-directed RNA polymerase subunit RPC12/RpoP
MSNTSTSPTEPAEQSDPEVGESIDSGKGRIFPCDRCGADLVFSIGQQSLQCPYCGSLKQIQLPTRHPVVERDYQQMLERLQRQCDTAEPDEETSTDQHEIHCSSCGAEVIFQGTLTSSSCPYCACPLQRDKIHDSVTRIAVDGVIPFLIPQPQAAENLRTWVKSLWWAPNEFLRQGASGKFNGVYLPFFTFDSMTFCQFTGQRGDAYYITVGEGNNRRTERRVNWTWASGEFDRFFDDVLVISVQNQNLDLVQSLEPWPLEQVVSYTPELLAGFFSRTYDITLEDGFQYARQRMEYLLTQEVRRRIGGDEQIVSSQNANYSAITFKHLLLPVWLLAYRYRDQTFQVMINAATGQVSGQRPYSWVKITFATVLAMIAIFVVWYFYEH